MIRSVVLALLVSAGSAAFAQTPPLPPAAQIVAQQRANLNRFQAQLQANQLSQLRRQNDAALASPDPDVQVQALIRRQQIQQQIDQNTDLQQRMLRPGSNPSDLSSQLQQYQAQIQHIRPAPAPGP
jgi:lipoprotein-anchoring transpeptidase ErfK/SrfK